MSPILKVAEVIITHLSLGLRPQKKKKKKFKVMKIH